jgi:acetyl-CoA acyltransferase 2
MTNAFIVAGKRTPFAEFGGSFKDITPVDLSVIASKALLEETKIPKEDIDHVILGNVVPSSTDTMYGGRHLALKLGLPVKTPGYNVNRLCGSGISIILDAVKMIKSGEAECVLASGTENMSMVPHLTYGARFGQKYGQLQSVDMLLDALTDKYSETPMGVTAENVAKDNDVNRESCDLFSMKSHQKVAKAYAENHFEGEIAPVTLKKKVVDKDEHFRADVNLETMQKLRPNFVKDGVVTAASASGIVDGAASVIIASEEYCAKNNLKPIAQIIDGMVVGVEPTLMGIGPVPAIGELLIKNELTLDDIDLFEINEAFAGQILGCLNQLSIPEEKLNVWGGAIALGHPLGATGVRISTTLARSLNEYKKSLGIASACIGGGQGIAILLKNVNV